MNTVLAGIDGSSKSEQAARSAVFRARDLGANVTFVGVVRPGVEPQPAAGERLRRFQTVEARLAGALEFARAEAVMATP